MADESAFEDGFANLEAGYRNEDLSDETGQLDVRENKTNASNETEGRPTAGQSSQLDNVFDIDAAAASVGELFGKPLNSEPLLTSANNNTASTTQDIGEAQAPRASAAPQMKFPPGSAQAAIAKFRQGKRKAIARPTSNTTLQPLQGKRKRENADEAPNEEEQGQSDPKDKRARMG